MISEVYINGGSTGASYKDKFVELYMAELSEDAQKLGPEVLELAATKGRDEIVAQCKAKSTPKATVQRCLEVTSMEAFKNC